MTVEYLLNQSVPLQAGDTVLFLQQPAVLACWRASG